MDDFSIKVVRAFLHKNNYAYIKSQLARTFPQAEKYLERDLASDMIMFRAVMMEEMHATDIVRETQVSDVLRRFNAMFFEAESQILEEFHRGAVARNVESGTKDHNLDTSRHDIYSTMTTEQLLRKWEDAPTKTGGVLRDDAIGDKSYAKKYSIARPTMIEYVDPETEYDMPYDHAQSMFDKEVVNHALNNTSRPHEKSKIGSGDIANDVRLLQRNIFRKNELGQANGISQHERRLLHRQFDRDISEGLGANRQLENRSYGYDMSDLRAPRNY